jgi:hypothetical protein
VIVVFWLVLPMGFRSMGQRVALEERAEVVQVARVGVHGVGTSAGEKGREQPVKRIGCGGCHEGVGLPWSFPIEVP